MEQLPIPQETLDYLRASIGRDERARQGEDLSRIDKICHGPEWSMRHWHIKLTSLVQNIEKQVGEIPSAEAQLRQAEADIASGRDRQGESPLPHLEWQLENGKQNMRCALQNRDIAVTAFMTIADKVMQGRAWLEQLPDDFPIRHYDKVQEWLADFNWLYRNLWYQYEEYDKPPWEPWIYLSKPRRDDPPEEIWNGTSVDPVKSTD